MSTELTPLFDKTTRSDADQDLVSGVLGETAAGEMVELTGEQPTTQNHSEAQQIELSGNEAAYVRDIEKIEMTDPEVRIEQYIEYYKPKGYDRKPILLKFVFNDDGTVASLTGLFFNRYDLSSEGLPPGLVEVHGVMELEECKLNNLEGFPDIVTGGIRLAMNNLRSVDSISRHVGGGLDLSENPITNLEALKGVTIGGDLKLVDIPATSIPEGIDVKGNIIIYPNQTKLAADARRKGYNVIEAEQYD